MDTMIKLPFYAKAALFLIGLYVFVSILYISQDLLLPLIYATIVAILLSPLVNFLVGKKVNRAVAISVVMFITFLIVGGGIALLASQASLLHRAWPKLLDKLQELLKESITWASGFFNISAQKINNWVTETTNDLMKNRNAALGSTLTTMGGIMEATVLTPVYIFMILFYQPHLLEFTHKVFGANNDNKVSEILTETKNIIHRYIAGLFAEFIVIAILNSIGLLALRIEYAVLLGVIGAVLNVIPIIGGVVCVALFVIIALLTKSPVYVVYVVGLYTLIQFIDDHYIFPKVVGSKVKLNVLISVVAVILGDALWGIPGMFLAIPLIAVVKLVFDRFEALKPWGFLLGATNAGTGETETNFNFTDFIGKIRAKFRKAK
jgi:predicted PurR-regulated permease PerM